MGQQLTTGNDERTEYVQLCVSSYKMTDANEYSERDANIIINERFKQLKIAKDRPQLYENRKACISLIQSCCNDGERLILKTKKMGDSQFDEVVAKLVMWMKWLEEYDERLHKNMLQSAFHRYYRGDTDSKHLKYIEKDPMGIQIMENPERFNQYVAEDRYYSHDMSKEYKTNPKATLVDPQLKALYVKMIMFK